MHPISIGRIGTPTPGAYRVLVDRLWPRGVRKGEGLWDEWIKDVAPSTALRRWYGHDPARYPEFRDRYRQEIKAQQGEPALRRLLQLVGDGPAALVTATRDFDRSHVPVLAAFLVEAVSGPASSPPGSPDS